MNTFLSRLRNTALLGIALCGPMLMTPALHAADKVYHDKAHNDDHNWNAHEDKAYGIWVKENHRKHVNFAKLNEADRERYWAWRHDHSDVDLKIDIH